MDHKYILYQSVIYQWYKPNYGCTLSLHYVYILLSSPLPPQITSSLATLFCTAIKRGIKGGKRLPLSALESTSISESLMDYTDRRVISYNSTQQWYTGSGSSRTKHCNIANSHNWSKISWPLSKVWYFLEWMKSGSHVVATGNLTFFSSIATIPQR